MRALKVIYVLAIAVALVLLVVAGVEAFLGEAHNGDIFFIVLPLGAVFAVVGTFIQRRSGIFGAGLILGGIGTMIFAVVPYDLDDMPRFIGIAVILAVLIFMGYKVFLASRKS
jgi:hypothetical protein